MREILLAVLIISILAMLFESIVVFKNLKNKLHAYLFLNCITMIVNDTGYLMQLLSKTEEAYITALKFSYSGRVWILFSLLMFTVELCHVKISALLISIFIFIDTAVYAVIFTVPDNPLFYSMIWFDKSKLFPVLLHRSGIVHKIFMQFQAVVIIIIMFWLFKYLHSLKGKTARLRIWIIITGFLTEAVLYILQVTHLFFFTYFYDLSVLGSFAITISMFIAIFKFNLLGIIDMAKEYIVDRLSEGVIAVDRDGRVQYYNEHIKELYPEINKDPEAVVDLIKKTIIRKETISSGERYYTPEEKELSQDGEILGMLYALVDTTVLKQNEYKLKSDAAMLKMAANSMRDRLLTAEEIMKQDRTMRHDRRHFEALILSLIQDGKADEAKKYLEERLSQEPRSMRRYCENTTVNAALTHYVTMAERKSIKVTVQTHIPIDPGVDEMQLAIAISNLFENAIHACEKLPEGERFIGITARFKEQLLLEIVNSCAEKVELDEEGHPFADVEGHGIGTKSVVAFAEKTGSEIRYAAEDNRFKVRMMIP